LYPSYRDMGQNFVRFGMHMAESYRQG